MDLNKVFSEQATNDIQHKIVDELLNQNNLSQKTELDKPLNWSCLEIIQIELTKANLPKSAQILEDFKNYTFRFFISKNRKGRLEYVDALKSINSGLTLNPNSMENPNKLKNLMN